MSTTAKRNVVTLDDLPPGTIIQNKGSGLGYVVTVNYGSRVTAVRTVDVTNCQEWVIVELKSERA